MFPLQRLGAEVWAIHTVQFSNHTGYGAWTGEVFGGATIATLIDGIAARGMLGRCDAVLSGYMGDAAIGEAILGAVARVRAANPRALYCCDPVIGDFDTGIYVRPGIAEFFAAHALPAADLATPNQFELEHFSRGPIATLAEAKAAVASLQARMREGGPRAVLLTSLRTEDTPDDAIDLLAGEGGLFFRVRTPRLDLSVNGAGDAMAALFLYHRLASADVATALANAAASIFGLLRRTAAAGSREILLIAAQEEFVAPTRNFVPERC